MLICKTVLKPGTTAKPESINMSPACILRLVSNNRDFLLKERSHRQISMQTNVLNSEVKSSSENLQSAVCGPADVQASKEQD